MKRTWCFVLAGVVVLAAMGVSFLLVGNREEPAELIEPGTVLRVGMECDYAPYNWMERRATAANLPLMNDKGAYANGYDVQIAQQIARRLSAKVQVWKIAWGELLPALKEGRIDMVISGMADIPERKDLPDFSASRNYNVRDAEYSLMVRKDSRFAEAATLADFYGAKIQGQKETRLDKVIDQIYGVRHIPPADKISEMMWNLDCGTVDGVVINAESCAEYIRQYPDLMAVHFARNEGFQLDFTGICVWCRKGDATLMKAVNWAIGDIPVATRQKLMERMETRSGEGL